MAGTAERTLALKLIADVGALDKSMKKVDGRLAKSRKAVVSWGEAFSGALVIGGIERAVDLLGDAWKGFREGQKVAAQLGVTWRNLGLSGRDLAGTLDKITSAATRVGQSDDEAVLAFNRSIKRTKDADKSYQELQIAMDLVANGAAPDLQSAMRIIEGAFKGSARVTDRFGLTAKTAGGRIKQLGDRVKGAADEGARLDPIGTFFTVLSEDLESIVGSLATGDPQGALDSFADAGTHIGDAWGGVSGAVPVLKDLADNVAPKVQSTLQALGGVLAGFGTAWDAIKPLIQPVLDLLGATLSSVSDGAVKALSAIGSALKGDFGGAWKTILSVVQNAVRGMIDAWNRLDISVPPFELTWGGGTIFPGTPLAFDIPAGSFRFWSGTGDLFPDLGGGNRQGGPGGHRGRGAHGSPPAKASLPSHKDGLDYVPYDGYVAQLHKGERVMTAAENRGAGASYSISVYVAPGGDLVEAGRQMTRAIQEYEKRAGKNWRN